MRSESPFVTRPETTYKSGKVVQTNETTSPYEEKFEAALVGGIQPGDTVWDIGANVGYFTTRFSAAAGTAGKVFAFEPAPGSFGTLTNAAGSLQNVKLENTALADFDGQADFRLSEDENDPTNSLARSATDSASVKVNVFRGDTYCASHPGSIPQRIKIDVEGFEQEVLEGLPQTLKSPQLKSLFIEVHFAILASRGRPSAPAQITSLLKERGFNVRWVGPSHLVASRPE